MKRTPFLAADELALQDLLKKAMNGQVENVLVFKFDYILVPLQVADFQGVPICKTYIHYNN